MKYRINKKLLNKVFIQRVNLQDISILCNNLGQMIESGLSISEIFNIVCTQNRKSVITESMYKVQRSIERGETLYESIKKFSHIYPLFMIEMIKVGEESGKLEIVLKYLSEYYDKRYKIFNKIKSAISYPIMVLITSIIVIIFLMIKIVPEFMVILSNSGGSIPILTSTILWIFVFLKDKFFIINLILITTISILYKFSRTHKGKEYFDSLKIRLPVIGTIYSKFLLHEFSKSLAILISSGIPIIKSLNICLSTVQNKVLENKIINSIEDIKKGESMYFSFKKQGIGDSTFLNLINIGEECGDIESILFKISNIFECEVEDRLKRMVNFIEPVTILVLAVFIGVFVVGTLLPIFNIMDSIN
ncbi:type II secretion system F family protein [Clostridium scatologenes]|uniref:type II secretion system F family protein n=1 Tax=Clostridium scatologenes TaxID=1548 RepID=UPI001FA6D507|nr:type II secretion system F family protein [Clostridium scatologenes]